ncbi:MAG: protein kinase, partial [Myxococcota bacterium]
MSEEAWQARWSADLQQSWELRHRMSGAHGPRVSIRPDPTTEEDLGAFDTRPLSVDEHRQVQQFVPDPATRRRIVTLDTMESASVPDGERQEIEIKALIAKGGMGAVYRGRQVSLDREVAVKRLRPNDKMPDGEALFESEGCITAILDHPNIVPVYDMGVDQHDRLFYSMKRVHGTPWDEVLGRRDPQTMQPASGDKQDTRAHLDILLEVANA